MSRREESAREIAARLAELERLAEEAGMPFLAYLIQMALQEAAAEVKKPGH